MRIGEADLDEAVLGTIADLASPAMQGEQELFESLLALPPHWIQRIPSATARSGECHDNVAWFIDGDSELEPVYGWVDLGEHLILHSVARWTNAPAGAGSLVCVTPGQSEWLVFRPDPALKLVEPWTFKRGGVHMPRLVRRDPIATADEAQRVLRELRAGTCEGWSARIGGNLHGAEPDRVLASIAVLEWAAQPA